MIDANRRDSVLNFSCTLEVEWMAIAIQRYGACFGWVAFFTVIFPLWYFTYRFSKERWRLSRALNIEIYLMSPFVYSEQNVAHKLRTNVSLMFVTPVDVICDRKVTGHWTKWSVFQALSCKNFQVLILDKRKSNNVLLQFIGNNCVACNIQLFV